MNERQREHVQSLKQDLVESPVSKHKHKQLARDLKEAEKKGFAAAVKVVFERIT